MDDFRQHSCDGEDNKSGFQMKTGPFAKPGFVFKIEKVPKILGEGNFVLVTSSSRKPAVDDHVIAFSNDQARLVLQRRWRAPSQIEQAVARRDVRAVLNVVR
jgi:hypothetical protein